MNRGYTLIEVLIFLAIFSAIIITFFTIFITFINIEAGQSAVAAVNQESQFLLQQIQHYVSSARLVDMPLDVATSTLTVREALTNEDPTSLALGPGITLVEVETAQGNGYPGTAPAVTFSTSTTAGELIIVAMYTGPHGTVVGTPTDNKGDVFTKVFDQPVINEDYSLWYASNVPAGVDTVSSTLGVNNYGEFTAMIVAHYQGLVSNPFDTATSTTHTLQDQTSPWTSSVVAMSQAKELIVGGDYCWSNGFGGCSNQNINFTGGLTREATTSEEDGDFDQLIYGDQIASTIISPSAMGAGGSGANFPFVATFKGALPQLLPNTVYLQQGVGSTWYPLTSNKVTVSNLIFTRRYNSATSSAFGTDSVSYSFTMSATTTSGSNYSQTFQSSAAVLQPVPKIALIQQTSMISNNSNVSSLSVRYPTNNETSSLLLAVVANTTSTATTTLLDSAGNTWSLIASTSYPAYNEKLTLWDAPNAINSSNTVTASFGPGAGYAMLNLYEYRGASISSPFDNSSIQLQPNTQNPSSGFANATSAVELLFGVTYNGNTAEIPSAGTGFIMETTSTAPAIFVEDSTQYVTGPVAATWQYSGTAPSSSAVIATFK